MKELAKFNFKINAIPNELEKYMSFNINDKLVFIDSFQFLSFSSDILVKNLDKNYFKCFNQEFYTNLFNLVKQKGFYPHEHLRGFEKFKEKFPNKEINYSSLTAKKLVIKSMVLKVWNTF